MHFTIWNLPLPRDHVYVNYSHEIEARHSADNCPGVNLPSFGKITTYTVSNMLSSIVLPVSQVRITGRNRR
jgi:hypothetical protein